MPQYSLTVSRAEPGRYRWLIILLKYPLFDERCAALRDYESYEAALSAGNLELARLDKEPLTDNDIDPDRIGWA